MLYLPCHSVFSCCVSVAASETHNNGLDGVVNGGSRRGSCHRLRRRNGDNNEGQEVQDEFRSGASFIFGDSLVDAGNNNFIPTLSRANMTPNGIDFAASGGMPTGRFTNGRTIADIIGEMLGQADYSPPFLSPNTSGGAILNGVNYASGGAGILNGTGKVFVNRIGMDVQIDYFNITRKQLDDLLGKDRARAFLRNKAIFSVTIGSNDFLNNYLMPLLSVGTRVSESPDAFLNDLISHLRDQLTVSVHLVAFSDHCCFQ